MSLTQSAYINLYTYIHRYVSTYEYVCKNEHCVRYSSYTKSGIMTKLSQMVDF